MKEKLSEEAKKLAKQYQEEMKSSIGELYEKHKDELAYFIEELAYLQAMVALKIADENLKEDLESIKIGMESTINSLTYETSEEGSRLFKELFATATKILIQTALGAVAV